MSPQTSAKTPTPPTLPPGVTKTCHIVKRTDFDGYGFNLHSEKVKPGQFIGKVDAKSPAESAGLKEGDRILEVNGVSIGSETHKQVVARIKAIASEVRLLLIDVDGKPIELSPPSPSALSNCSEPTNGNVTPNANVNGNGYEGTKQEMPGASANISSISMVSMKRSSNASSIQSGSTMNASDLDVVDRGIPPPVAVVVPSPQQNGSKPSSPSPINNNTLMSTPPPPSAAVATMNSNGNVYSSSNGNTNGMASPTATPTAMTEAPTATPMSTAAAGNRAGSLNLPPTAAEMRAKLASKKKYDPKNESVDLKKKFDIIQKL
ncbi:Na(+)/H(+) exchange regulatory cofactor NHE-RF1 [Drosophila obscura]|uniref:Na(+)/H(+) exchange regulatory cofactor NHE-RF1 n=1 Tax=Drosophila obscura TaxID=7282 RepID=UPI001BB20932|nr:Na(+)/H(+) exchange regulatory cofactor NHE-RF1 [Drosophila obscura]XP_022226493.2 Na(+)/H(+) exchange regulatory cofactor NHE-RF1 [Drosophila obscura]